MSRNLRVVFMGSPAFALPTLEALAKHYQVVGVVSQPDRIRGRRGGKAIPTVVKKRALEKDIPVITPEKLNTSEAFQQLTLWNPDVIVVVAYSKLLKRNVLALPPLGCVNLHPSLLPLYRGPSPIQAALLEGDSTTGNTTFLMAEGYDTGDILMQGTMELSGHEHFSGLMDRLADAGAQLIVETVAGLADGSLTGRPQKGLDLPYTQKISKQDALLDWQAPADRLEREVRAYYEFPASYFKLGKDAIKVGKARLVDASGTPGEVVALHKNEGFAVACQSKGLLIEQVKPPGKSWMSAWSYLQGHPEIGLGYTFSEK